MIIEVRARKRVWLIHLRLAKGGYSECGRKWERHAEEKSKSKQTVSIEINGIRRRRRSLSSSPKWRTASKARVLQVITGVFFRFLSKKGRENRIIVRGNRKATDVSRETNECQRSEYTKNKILKEDHFTRETRQTRG